MTPHAQASAVTLVVLDSVGIGGAPDAADFGDAGSATLPHVAEAVGGLHLPNLEALGLGRITDILGVEPTPAPSAAHGALIETSPGKDTTTGHWELAGVVLEHPFPTYPTGFPRDIIDTFEERIGRPTIGNEVASGTEIITRLGDEHRRTGRPIVYTSADSVFQVAAHVDTIPLERQYEICRIARELMTGAHEVGRVIARPFSGEGSLEDPFVRTPDRHDFSVEPPTETVLDAISSASLEVRGVGKISDIFAGRGVTSSRPTKSNADGIKVLVDEMATVSKGLVFINLVDFDQAFGHRNDPEGYAQALTEFDAALPGILAALGEDGVLIITADHGNDPTTPSTDHSRERVPILVYGSDVHPSNVGERPSFADCGATICELLGVGWSGPGESFAHLLSKPH
jgi:phosphopentomutase